jgi:hypothetical protein
MMKEMLMVLNSSAVRSGPVPGLYFTSLKIKVLVDLDTTKEGLVWVVDSTQEGHWVDPYFLIPIPKSVFSVTWKQGSVEAAGYVSGIDTCPNCNSKDIVFDTAFDRNILSCKKCNNDIEIKLIN